jgi:hypothetical protein
LLQYMAVAARPTHWEISAFWERWYPALNALPFVSMQSAIVVPTIVAHREAMERNDWVLMGMLLGMSLGCALLLFSTVRHSPTNS